MIDWSNSEDYKNDTLRATEYSHVDIFITNTSTPAYTYISIQQQEHQQYIGQ